MTGQAVPRIDIQSPAAADQIAQALSTLGTFRCDNHGLGQNIARCRAMTEALFGLPVSELLRVRQPRWDVFAGYVPLGEEGRPGGDGGDLKRSFCVAPEHVTHPDAFWPAGLPEFRDAVTAYYRKVEELAATVRRLIATGLGHDAGYFEPSFQPPASLLKLIEYPVLPVDDPALATAQRAAEHTDFEFLTILWQQDRPGGLQVRAPDGTWLDVPADEDGFVVTAGDLLARWTDGQIRAVPHRVVNPPPGTSVDATRMSFAFFNQPSPDALVSPPGSSGAALTAGAYLQERFVNG